MVGNTLLLLIDVRTIVFVFTSSYKPVVLTTILIFTGETPSSAPAPARSPSPNSPPIPPAPSPIPTLSPLAIIS